MKESSMEDGFHAEYLKVYYGKIFPYEEIFKWLSYGNEGKHPGCDSSYFGRREFSFTLENDIYLRFLSFGDASELEKTVKEKCPYKIDIGPVYSVDPAKRHAYSQSGNSVFHPEERELVFDIDISDYDDIRYCCSGADTCSNCWPLMTAAIRVIDGSLRGVTFFYYAADFGFNHILWVYSGRRGVHCWVCDRRARRLTNEQRTAVVEYLRVYMGNENNNKKASLSGHAIHPSLVIAYTDVLKAFFEEKFLISQDFFATEERYKRFLDMIPDDDLRLDLHRKWHENQQSSKENINSLRWKQLKHALQSSKKAQSIRRCIEEIIFSCTYPRLDMEVSKHMNHLLKAPFCVHPKTGHVCVPIDPELCDVFDPTTVPTLSKLLEELNSGVPNDLGDAWERTSLEKSIQYFRTSFLCPLLKSCKEELTSMHIAKRLETKNNLSW